jgi:hypothetical protein
MEKKNEAAFPREWSKIKQSKDAPEQISVAQKGLTKLEYFAAMAMQGMLASGYGDFNDKHIDYISELAIKQADNLLTALDELKK